MPGAVGDENTAFTDLLSVDSYSIFSIRVVSSMQYFPLSHLLLIMLVLMVSGLFSNQGVDIESIKATIITWPTTEISGMTIADRRVARACACGRGPGHGRAWADACAGKHCREPGHGCSGEECFSANLHGRYILFNNFLMFLLTLYLVLSAPN